MYVVGMRFGMYANVRKKAYRRGPALRAYIKASHGASSKDLAYGQHNIW